MSILENYNREDKFVRSLNIAFDNYIELDKEKIEEILNFTDIVENNDLQLSSMTWDEIYKSNDIEFQNKLVNRFSYEINRNHKHYQITLKRFIEEHLKFPSAITFILKNQIRHIKDVVKRLEIDYFKQAESDYDNIIFRFKDESLSLLENLIETLKIEYLDYLKESNLDDIPILELDDDGLDFNTVASKVVLLNEFGIIDLIKNMNKDINNTHLANIVSKITGSHTQTIRRCINDLNTSQKNDPYKSGSNIKKTESLFNLYGISKKGE